MGETLADIGEFGLIRRIEEILRQQGVQAPGLRFGIGDDAACFRPREGMDLLVTCDAIVEGKHYLPEHITPFDLGRRAMTLNISDIGAMGGLPLYALVSLGLRAETPAVYVEDLYRGFAEELNPLSASVIGGNLTHCADRIFIDITLIGEAERGKVVRRSTARNGDSILITGFPGQASAGLNLLLQRPAARDQEENPLVRAYNRPSHRAREGNAIAVAGFATAMIDTSDGLMGDLMHICEESGVGAELIQERLPVSEPLREAAVALGQDPYDLVLGKSDDYELIITCSPHRVEPIRAMVASLGDVPVTEVGLIVEASPGIQYILPGGKRRKVALSGWDHFSD